MLFLSYHDLLRSVTRSNLRVEELLYNVLGKLYETQTYEAVTTTTKVHNYHNPNIKSMQESFKRYGVGDG
jgi:hypothetical protein